MCVRVSAPVSTSVSVSMRVCDCVRMSVGEYKDTVGSFIGQVQLGGMGSRC